MSHHSKKNHSHEKNPQDFGAEKHDPADAKASTPDDKIEVPIQEYEGLKKQELNIADWIIAT